MQHRTNTAAPFDEIVRKMEPEDLFALGDSMGDLTANLDYKRLVDLVERALENAHYRLVHGPLLSEAEYGRALGMIAGLEMIKEIPKIVVERAEKRQETLEQQTEELSAERR